MWRVTGNAMLSVSKHLRPFGYAQGIFVLLPPYRAAPAFATIPRMNPLAPGRARNYALLALAAAALLAWAALAVPEFDDGLDGHMVLDSPPYYSEPHGLYFPFYKPHTTALLPLRLVSHPWGFMLAAMLHAALIAAAAWLTYKVARRYAAPNVATLAGLLTLFALTATANFPAIRPEAILIATLMGVVYLCDTWRLDGNPKHLVFACVLAGALGLPTHSNASIIYIYLALFAIWQRNRLTRRDWVVAIGTLTASSLVGLAIVLVPHPSHLFELLRQLGVDGQRYTFVMGEIRRFLFLARPAPLLSLAMFLGLAGLAAIALERPTLRQVRCVARRYWGVLIVALSVFVGLAVVPAAEWVSYVYFYFPALCILGALAYHRCPPLWVSVAAGVVMLAVIALEVPIITAMRGGLREWMVVGLVYSAIATPLLCWSWYKGDRRWLFAALALGFVVVVGLRYADRVAFDDISEAIRETAEEVGAREVIAIPHFIWVFNRSEYDYVTMPYQSHETPALTNAVVVLSGHSYVRGWLARANEVCDIEERRRVPVSGFAQNKLRGESDYWTIGMITCHEPAEGE